jgi:hypothetical protein
MPTPILNSDQLQAVRSDYYSGKGYLAVVSNSVVFQAEVASTPVGDVFGAIFFTNVSVGSWTDIREGQTVLISTTISNYNVATGEVYRVRKPPTVSILYVNEMSISLNAGDIITVINSYLPQRRDRRLNYVDYDLPFQDLAPLITNMDSAYAALTEDSEAQFSFAPVGLAMADGATIASYAWDIPGAVYNTGSASTQNVTVTIPETTEWGRLTVTDSNGVSTWFAFSLHIGDPNTDPRFILCHDPVTIEADIPNGYNASTTAYANYTLTTVMDRTRVAVIVKETYGPEDDPDLGNVRFVGYTVKDSSTTRGDEKFGAKKSTSIEMRGFKAFTGQIPVFPIAVRDVDPPTEWDQMTKPTTERVISHLITRHSTLANLCSVDFPDFAADPDHWFGSNFDITDTSLMDAVRTVASEINGDLVSEAAGGFVFERDANFLDATGRNALPTVTPSAMNAGDRFELTLERTHEPRVGKVEMGARVFFSDGTPSVGYTAMAPAVAIGEGQERVQIPNALLPADDAANAPAAAARRSSYWYAFKNNLMLLNDTLTDGWGCISPSTAQWWPFEIEATDTTRGVVITTATRWLLLSMRTVINQNGTQDVGASWMPETTPGRALILVAVSPSVALTELPILPVRSAYPPYPPAASINYPTTDPTTRQHRDPFSGMQTTPWPTREAAQAAALQPTPGCATAYTNLRYASNVTMGFTTTLGAAYTLSLSGYGTVGTGAVSSVTYDFRISDYGFIPYANGIFGDYAEYVPGEGWQQRAAVPQPAILIKRDLSGQLVTQAEFFFNEVLNAYSNVAINVRNYAANPAQGSILATSTNKLDTYTFSGLSSTGTLEFESYTAFDAPNVRLYKMILTGAVTPPNPRKGDWFYTWVEDDEGNPTDVQLNTTGGFYINNGPIAVVPPFNPNHEYSTTYIGDGSPIIFRYEDADYSDNSSSAMHLRACGPGAGS